MKKTGLGSVILERQFIPQGHTLIKEGDYGAQAFLIQSGSVKIFTEHEGKEVVLAKLGPGQIIGEMALIFDGPRTASVRALEDCNVVVITREQFRHKLEKTDQTVRAIVKMLCSRIIASNNTLLDRKGNVDDLKDSMRAMYRNIAATLPQTQLRTFQNTVLPHLDGFLESIESFQDRYGTAGEE